MIYIILSLIAEIGLYFLLFSVAPIYFPDVDFFSSPVSGYCFLAAIPFLLIGFTYYWSKTGDIEVLKNEIAELQDKEKQLKSDNCNLQEVAERSATVVMNEFQRDFLKRNETLQKKLRENEISLSAAADLFKKQEDQITSLNEQIKEKDNIIDRHQRGLTHLREDLSLVKSMTVQIRLTDGTPLWDYIDQEAKARRKPAATSDSKPKAAAGQKVFVPSAPNRKAQAMRAARKNQMHPS